MPWVLDPVFIDRSRAARRLRPRARWRASPTAIRLNRAEFAALAGAEPDDDALRALCARAMRTVIGLTGETDLVTDGDAAASRSPTAIR